jgi:hypothetical protein
VINMRLHRGRLLREAGPLSVLSPISFVVSRVITVWPIKVQLLVMQDA